MSLQSGLVAWWSLQENNGLRMSHNSLNNLVPQTAVTGIDGIVTPYASHFNSASSHRLSLPNNNDLKMGDIDFSFCFWASVDSTSGPRTILSKFTSSNIPFRHP